MAMLFFLSPILSQALTSSQENKCPQSSLQDPMTVNVFFAVYSEKKGNHDTPDGESIEQQRQRESIQKHALEPANEKLFEQLGVQLKESWKFLNYDESKNVNGETPCTGKELNMGRDGSIIKELNWLTNELDTNQKKFGPEEHFAMFVLFAKCNTGTFNQQTHVNKPEASVISLDDNHIQKKGENDLLISFMRALGLQKTQFLDNKGNVQFSNETKKAMCNDLDLLSRDAPNAIQEGPVTVKSTTKTPIEQAAAKIGDMRKGRDFLSAQQQAAVEEGDMRVDIAEKEGNGPTLFTAGIEYSAGCDTHTCLWSCLFAKDAGKAQCEGNESGCKWEERGILSVIGSGTCSKE